MRVKKAVVVVGIVAAVAVTASAAFAGGSLKMFEDSQLSVTLGKHNSATSSSPPTVGTAGEPAAPAA